MTYIQVPHETISQEDESIYFESLVQTTVILLDLTIFTKLFRAYQHPVIKSQIHQPLTLLVDAIIQQRITMSELIQLCLDLIGHPSIQDVLQSENITKDEYALLCNCIVFLGTYLKVCTDRVKLINIIEHSLNAINAMYCIYKTPYYLEA